MDIPLAKLKAIILYLSQNSDPRFFGKVKLMKLLYFVDFTHVKQHGIPVTGDNYINMEHGPVPSTIKNLVYSVASEPNEALLADIINIETTSTTGLHKITPMREFTEKDRDLISDSEMDVMKKISERFYSANKDAIEKAAHEEAPWKTTDELDPIPYWLAAKDPDSRFTEDEIKFYMSL